MIEGFSAINLEILQIPSLACWVADVSFAERLLWYVTQKNDFAH